MTQKLILEDAASERRHHQRLRELATTSAGTVSIASAYVTERDFLRWCGQRDRRLLTSLDVMDIASGATSLECLRSLLECDVAIRFLPTYPRFHAKTYIFGSSVGIITSANLTRNALESNVEAGVEIFGAQAEELLAWFNRLWEPATILTPEQLVSLAEKVDIIRREYVKFKRKVKSTLEAETEPLNKGVYSDSVSKLLETAKRFFVINTNRRYDKRTATHGFQLEEKMNELGLATAWESFHYTSHMELVEPGDAVLAYAKGVGIIGIGIAKSKCETRDLTSTDRLRPADEENQIEWRVPTKWLVWVDAPEALRFEPINASFWKVADEIESKLRIDIAEHFLQ